jgi:hypothetical protein
MAGKRFAVASLAVLIVLGIACGKSKEAQAFDQLKAMCEGTVGTTLRQADVTLNSGIPVILLQCSTATSIIVPFLPLRCPEATQDNVECRTQWEWAASDPSLCSASTGGCCFVCEVRTMSGSVPAGGQPVDETICDARWFSGQICK